MGKLIAGFLIGVVLVLGAEYLFLTQGGMPVSARSGPLPLEKFLTSRALHTAMAKEAGRPSPIPPTEANLISGAKIYLDNCEGCHGAPDQRTPGAIARGMFPRPPQLMPPHKGVTDDPVGETYWKVKNGIRLTGMPGFEGSLTDEQLWQVSLLLLKADQLPAKAKAAMR
ncbi:MAG TPA: c-type cytochrome [Myxococcales bacterium]